MNKQLFLINEVWDTCTWEVLEGLWVEIKPNREEYIQRFIDILSNIKDKDRPELVAIHSRSFSSSQSENKRILKESWEYFANIARFVRIHAVITKIILNSTDYRFNFAVQKMIREKDYSFFATYVSGWEREMLIEAIQDTDPWNSRSE